MPSRSMDCTEAVAVIADFDLDLCSDEVIARLAPSGPAFRARPARMLVDELLARIGEERLVKAQASYRCIALRSAAGRGIDLDVQQMFEPGCRLSQRSRAGFLLVAAWSLGPAVSLAVTEAFRERRAMQALLLDEIASLLVFRLGEQLFARIRQRLAARGLGVGRPQAPGDGQVALAAQARLLRLAGAARIGVSLGDSGTLAPLKTATALAPVGQDIRQPRQDWSCAGCASRNSCRLRWRGWRGTGHGSRLR